VVVGEGGRSEHNASGGGRRAQIAKPSAGFQERKNWYFVHWFGTAQYGYVRKKDCLQFLEHREHFFAKPIKNQKWTLALEEISKKQEEQDRRPGGGGTSITSPSSFPSPAYAYALSVSGRPHQMR